MKSSFVQTIETGEEDRKARTDEGRKGGLWD